MIAVVMLDDDRYPAGPGTVVEVSGDTTRKIIDRYKDRDGVLPEHLRMWWAYEGCKVGDRVSIPKFACSACEKEK